MKFSAYIFPILVFISLQAAAHRHYNACSDGRIKAAASQRGTLASPLELDYDVKYVKIDVALDNTNTSVKGNTATQAKVVGSGGMSTYAFELNDNLTIDSAKMNGILVPVSAAGNHLRTISLPAALPLNAMFTAQIFYHGTALNGGTGFFNGGIVNQTLASGTKITYTMSDDYFARDWWPAKQVLQDKIDSVDLWVTVPAGTRAGGNGLLKQITPVPSGNRYQWKTKYPIDYYLISTAVAPYADHSQMLHFSNSTDSMLVQHYIYDTATFLPQIVGALDSTIYMVDYFSTLFGRYPYWEEKYGHCTAPLSGGMEHQTMTTLGAYTTPLIAHELGHQWWGDCVTYASWTDIWLSEGWASYCEQLYVAHFQGAAAAQTYRTAVFNRVMSIAGGTVYVPDTTNVLRTFNSRLTYDKGAAVAHMLRYIAPDDATYFSGLQAYQQQYKFKTATTTDFQAVMEAAYGRNLDTFFYQWVYGEGYPTYTAKWNQSNDIVLIQLKQTTSVPASIPLFITPVEIRLTSAAGDTIIKIYNNSSLQNISVTWSKTMTGLSIDPDNQILNKTGAITKDPSLAIHAANPIPDFRVFPNPARDSWQVAGVPDGATIELYNISGQRAWQGFSGTGKMIPAAGLPTGNYELRITLNDGSILTKKLVRW